MTTTSLTGIETALIALAAAQAVQTALLLAVIVGGWVAYSRATTHLARELEAMKVLAERAVEAVQETATVVGRAAGAVTDSVSDGREAVQAVASWAAPLASAVASPRVTAAAAVWRGIRWWRQRRDAARHRRALTLPR